MSYSVVYALHWVLSRIQNVTSWLSSQWHAVCKCTVYTVVCTGLRVLAASIRQCPSVEAWCHNSSQYIKWIFSQPLLHSACGQAVVECRFHCCTVHVLVICLNDHFFRAHNPLLWIYTFLTSLIFNFLHSAHGIRCLCSKCCLYSVVSSLWTVFAPPKALRTCLIHFQARRHTRWPNLALLLYLCWLIGCFSAFVALGCFCSDWPGRMSLKWFCSKWGYNNLNQ